MSDTRLRSAFAVILLAVALLLLRYEGDVFFTILAGVLFSIALVHPTTWLSRSLHLGYLGSLALLVVVVLAALGFGAWALGTRLADQLQSLSEELPRAATKLRHWLVHWTWANRIFGQVLESPERQVSAGNVVAGATNVAANAFRIAIALIATFFIGVYGAVQPGTYTNAFVRLFAPGRRIQIREILHELDHTLSRWLLGRVVAMVSVALLTSLGLAWANIPMSIALGALAGLFTFVEYLGAVLSAIPAALVALAQDPSDVPWVVVVFTVAHVVEGYLLTPFITRGSVRFPPAFTIGVQLLLGSVFGYIGLTFATPAAVIVVVFTRKLYFENIVERSASS